MKAAHLLSKFMLVASALTGSVSNAINPLVDFNCGARVPFGRDQARLVKPVRTFGKVDLRKELPESTLAKKLTPKQLKQLRKMVGAIYCPPSPGFPKLSLGTAFVIGASNELFTAAHNLKDENGNVRDLSGCLFTNFDSPRTSIPIDAKAKRNKLPDWGYDTGEGRYDRARLVLSKPITGAPPLAPDFTQKPLTVGQEIYTIAAQSKDFKTSDKEPIVSPCVVGEVTTPGDGLSRMRNGCSGDRGGSGGPVITVENGTLSVRAMYVAETAYGAADNAEYDSASNAQKTIVLDGDFLDWVARKK